MDIADYISERTSIAVRQVSEKLAPTCVGCPFAKVFISEQPDPMRDAHLLKINFRCDRMGMAGKVCPDGGDPTLKYAKDAGMRRNISEQQFAVNVNLERHMMDATTSMVSDLLKNDGYMDMLKAKIHERKDLIGESFHILNETIAFVTENRHTSDHPILWVGDEIETLSEAREEFNLRHKREYRQNVDNSSQMCKPTPYMKDHFQTIWQTPFGIFVDYKGNKHQTFNRGIAEVVHIPKEFEIRLSQEEIYEDWGSFG